MESFREKTAYNDGSYFLLIYDGTPIELTDDERSEVDRRLHMFMDNREIHSDVIKNVSFIRTIFIDYDEHYLYIKYHDKNKDEYVEYKDKELTLYDVNIKEVEKKKKGKDSKEKNYLRQKGETLNSLKNIGPIGVLPLHYKLIDMYNYFYNMHPNFSNNQINILFQCMIQILKRFDIDLIELNDFTYNEEIGINTSPTLEKMVNDLFPYGMIKTKDNDREIKDEEKEKIKTVGSIIINNIHGVDRVQRLINITKLLCPSEKELDDINKINEINNNSHNLELIKQINEAINS